MRCIAVLSALAGLLIASQASAQSRPDVFNVRYVLFVATPVPGNPIKPNEMPLFLKRTENGFNEPLGTDPSAFLNRLRALDPGFRYEPILSGVTACREGEPSTFTAGPRPGDVRFFTVTDTITVKRTGPGTVQMNVKGKVSYDVPPKSGTGRDSYGWNGIKRQAVIGQTSSHGSMMEGSGQRIVYAWCVLSGNGKYGQERLPVQIGNGRSELSDGEPSLRPQPVVPTRNQPRGRLGAV